MNAGQLHLPLCSMCLEPDATARAYIVTNPKTEEQSFLKLDDACADVCASLGWNPSLTGAFASV